MEDVKDIEWFKNNIAPKLKGYEFNYRFFKEGDFGSLNQVEFNSKKIGGNIDFWSREWLGVFVWNYETEEQLLNVLLEPHQRQEKEETFKLLEELIIEQ
ncbi:hypothetical protein A9P82_08440 [Arachidicoccus ginsenosidimutans]|uniref:hypothetical protein n=1 Tax=Arachidicoccus sp. BS20 TaxID=1850526 RepID=UPI0007F17C23|nr:hypothetical protein [Arachidicoccus sp. BS20]ANI89304.1 hypothetical protein A9P82_08370 [Arachidicoccus sp. BS20]ANI89317.1 hypothetical protein A9P82_08440 [Arachidicoccus sp. BS20]